MMRGFRLQASGFGVFVALCAAPLQAQPASVSLRRGEQAPPAQRPTAEPGSPTRVSQRVGVVEPGSPTRVSQRVGVVGTGEVTLTATSANVSEPGSPVKIRILRWSTDEERTPLLAALNPPAPVTPPAGTAAALPTGAGPNPSAARGLPAGAAATPSAAPGLPAEAGANPSAAAGDRGGAARAGRADTGRAGRAGAGRGARGGARGGRGDAAPPTPIAVLTAAIGKAPTLGYIWTSDITGYAIKYAYRASLPDGGERIILATNRRLGAHMPAWKPVATTPLTDYEFTLIEIRLNSKGMGEAKTSLTTKVIVDDAAKTVALDGYATTPAVLQHVKR